MTPAAFAQLTESGWPMSGQAMWLTPGGEFIRLGARGADGGWTHVSYLLGNGVVSADSLPAGQDEDDAVEAWAYTHRWVRVVLDGPECHYIGQPTARQLRQLKDLAIEHGCTLCRQKLDPRVASLL